MKSFILSTILLLITSVLSATELTFYTEESPPFQVAGNSQRMSGISVEILELALNETPYTANYKILPWARAIDQLEKTPNSFLFSMIRTPQRENQYIWVGKLFAIEIHLWALKKNPHISISDVKDFQRYSIGALYKNIEHDYFRSIGLEDNLDLGYSPLKLTQKLFRNRVDIIPSNEHILKYQLTNEPSLKNYKFSELERLITIEEISGEAYLVTNKKTPAAMVLQLRAALKKVRQTPEYRQILRGKD
ncbi:substrate-binding periplasmic protein [Vibrio sp. SCSIO 43137]|uniref:substrate-binding periplasmic protein n=1 Tax=Vibrio sp. SCSIO 43137 TaxID=3021011 RepID=UPI002307E713|nr:transporter substrate-binding domain-containing protein [Vibrio sp. SCSIO 43137]WCE32418.1 transporter substrate-binding domain-containing protein [Vibrio sp. SCSIO 43137]